MIFIFHKSFLIIVWQGMIYTPRKIQMFGTDTLKILYHRLAMLYLQLLVNFILFYLEHSYLVSIVASKLRIQ